MSNLKIIFLFLFIVMILSSCESNKNPTVAIVNGVEIKAEQVNANANLDQDIEQTVVQTEAKRIGISPDEMFTFFDSLKTRKIPKDQLEQFMKTEFKDKDLKISSREEILNLMRKKQFEEAKKKYISELKNRSTIWVFQDGQKVKYQLK